MELLKYSLIYPSRIYASYFKKDSYCINTTTIRKYKYRKSEHSITLNNRIPIEVFQDCVQK